MSEIVEVQKENRGNEIGFVKLDDGRILSRTEACDQVADGSLFLPGIIVAESKEGEVYLRSKPDGDPSNNLQNLPPIKDFTGYKGSTNFTSINQNVRKGSNETS